jgi:hypothetical protein
MEFVSVIIGLDELSPGRSRAGKDARESRFNDMSPVVASMYCSPHPAALNIAPAARLRESCV